MNPYHIVIPSIRPQQEFRIAFPSMEAMKETLPLLDSDTIREMERYFEPHNRVDYGMVLHFLKQTGRV